MADPHATPKSRTGKPPAFQFYANDFLAGTATLTLAECGAYIRLLCHQWNLGGIPDDWRTIGQLIGTSAANAQKLWASIGFKFEKGDDGQLRNVRMEQVRAEQQSRSRAGSEGGKARAAKDQAEGKQTSSGEVSKPQAEGQAKPKPSSSSSSSSSEDQSGTETTTTISIPSEAPRGISSPSSPSLLRSPLDYDKKLKTCAYVGARLEIPSGLHANLVRETGGVNADGALRTFYAELDTELERTNGSIFPNVFDWTRAKWQDWMLRTGQAAVVALRGGGYDLNATIEEAKRIGRERDARKAAGK